MTNPNPQTRDAEFDFQTTSPKVRLSTCDDMSKLQGWITNILAQASPTTIQDRKYNACFKVVDPCAFLEFMREGYPRDTDLKRVLTLTGTSENAIAESAGYYVNKIWPKYGLPILDWIWQFFDIRNLCGKNPFSR